MGATRRKCSKDEDLRVRGAGFPTPRSTVEDRERRPQRRMFSPRSPPNRREVEPHRRRRGSGVRRSRSVRRTTRPSRATFRSGCQVPKIDPTLRRAREFRSWAADRSNGDRDTGAHRTRPNGRGQRSSSGPRASTVDGAHAHQVGKPTRHARGRNCTESSKGSRRDGSMVVSGLMLADVRSRGSAGNSIGHIK